MLQPATKRATGLLATLLWCVGLTAQIPQGYYNSAKGEKGKALKTALCDIVSSHTQLSYDQLWEAFKKTDVRPDGKIWDMYSNVTNYTPGGPEQGKNYSGEGDSYNREHSFPKSWFNDAKPMYTDLFHLYPTDGYVNNRRSNYPFGETKGETYKSSGGFSKVGSCTVSGYSGTVFEPADEYKGDFARTYFYMATAYEDKISSWSSPMLAGNKYPAYANWALTLMLRWAEEDPVSDKEIARNNAVYDLQNNRNPYIDYPGLEQYVWGTKTDVAFDPDNYTPGGNGGSETIEVAAPTFSPQPGLVAKGTEVTVACATEGALVHYSLNGAPEVSVAAPATFLVETTTSVVAYASLGDAQSETVSVVYTVAEEADQSEKLYRLVTDATQLVEGLPVLIVCVGQNTAMAEMDNNIRTYVDIDATQSEICTETGSTGLPYAFTLGRAGTDWTLFSTAEQVYLALTSSDNKLHSTTDPSDESAWWTIHVDAEGQASIASVTHPNRTIQYNASSPRFACYKSKQQPVSLFMSATPSSLQAVAAQRDASKVSVYNIGGQHVRTAATVAEALKGLPAGIYVVNGTRVLVGK